MSIKKFLLTTFTSLAMLMTAATVSAQDVSILVNGSKLLLNDPAVIVDGRTLVPVRAISEVFDAEVQWDDTSKTVTIIRDENSESGRNTLKLRIGEYKISQELEKEEVDYSEIELDVPAQIINNRTYVPLRAIGEMFSCYIGWDPEKRSVSIESNSVIFGLFDNFDFDSIFDLFGFGTEDNAEEEKVDDNTSEDEKTDEKTEDEKVDDNTVDNEKVEDNTTEDEKIDEKTEDEKIDDSTADDEKVEDNKTEDKKNNDSDSFIIAFDKLKEYLLTEGSIDGSGNYYIGKINDDDYYYSVQYTVKDGSIWLSTLDPNDNVSIIRLLRESYFFDYVIIHDASGINGEGSMEREDMSSETVRIYFDELNEDDEDLVETFGELGASFVDLTLTATDLLMSENNAPVTVNDLGFVQY